MRPARKGAAAPCRWPGWPAAPAGPDHESPAPMLNDGTVRLTFHALRDSQVVHLISGLDEDCPPGGGDAVLSAITGYTEWVSQEQPALTLGWDWQMQAASRVGLRRISAPRSNVRLLNAAGAELGHEQADTLLQDFIDGIDWQAEALLYIVARYAPALGAANGAAGQR